MSDSDRNGPEDSREASGGTSVPGPESTAEAKRIAARRRFLARGVGGAGFAILTLAHQRTNAWTWNPPTNTDHILSLPYSSTNASKAAVDCASFSRGRGYTAYKGAYEGQSPGNPTPKGSYVWYCGYP